jgi:hypothetical protein
MGCTLQKMEIYFTENGVYITENKDAQYIRWRYTFDEIKYCTCP